MSRFGSRECERARVLAALAPDGELSELERRGLRSHLRACRSCARFARGVDRVSALLRADELVQPSIPATVPHVVRRRRVATARLRPVAAAAAVALMALGIASRAPLDMEQRNSNARTTSSPGSLQLEQDSLRAWRHANVGQVNLQPMDRFGRNQAV